MKKGLLVQPDMTVAIMGLGVTGQAAARYCLDRGAAVKVSDTRGEAELLDHFGEYFAANDIRWEAGGHSASFLANADLVIISPGIPLTHPVVEELKEKEVPVVGELAVAAPELSVPVAAVTGTNGKTTVTSLLGHILASAGREVFVGGNIGTPLLDYLCSGEKADYLVLEVSSFQLETAGTFSPDIGLVLNITPDHLDRHADLDEYADIKIGMLQKVAPAGAAVLYGDDERCFAALDTLEGRVLTFGGDEKYNGTVEGTRVRVAVNGEPEIYELAGSPLGNAIGARNSAAAILAARFWGIGREEVQQALATFTPLPHRMEPAGELGGVAFINDSKATNTGAVVVALSQVRGSAILIAGGKDKGEDYSLLREPVKEKARGVVLIGEAAAKIEEGLDRAVPVFTADDLESAVRLAYSKAQVGDTVLLSPACASFDMFDNYAQRGRVFIESVERLIQESMADKGAENDG